MTNFVQNPSAEVNSVIFFYKTGVFPKRFLLLLWSFSKYNYLPLKKILCVSEKYIFWLCIYNVLIFASSSGNVSITVGVPVMALLKR